MKCKVGTCRETQRTTLATTGTNVKLCYFTSTQVGRDLAVAVALGADASPQELPGEPDQTTAARGLVAEVAAELAGMTALHEAETFVTGAALGGVAAGEVEGARPGQPVATLTHHDGGTISRRGNDYYSLIRSV